MKAKIVIELSEDFVAFIKEDAHITTAEELKGLLKGVWMESIHQIESGVVDLRVEVEE